DVSVVDLAIRACRWAHHFLKPLDALRVREYEINSSVCVLLASLRGRPLQVILCQNRLKLEADLGGSLANPEDVRVLQVESFEARQLRIGSHALSMRQLKVRSLRQYSAMQPERAQMLT